MTEREVRTDYRRITIIYHPDKHRLDPVGMSPNQAEEYLNWLTMRTIFYAQMRNAQKYEAKTGETQDQ